MNSYRDPTAQWLGSSNFRLDRQGHDMAIPPAYVIIHTMVGTIESANSRFQNSSEAQPGGRASAHYGVGYNGDRLVQWVDEKDAAWHTGDFEVNLDSIAIEHEDMGRYDDPRPDGLYAASGALVRRICQRYGITIDRAHIRAHREVSDAPTACPDALDVDRIVATAATGQEDDEVNQTLQDRLDQLCNVVLGGGDNRVPNPAIFAVLAAIRGDDADLLAAVQDGQQRLMALQADIDGLRSALSEVVVGDVDETRLAAELAPVLGADVAAELARRLAA
jgi:N-acetylmuramoyl-L-alanine amidase